MTPRTDAVVESPMGKQYRIVGPADEIFPDQFKSKTNVRAGTRLWVLCGFELDDHPVMKDTDTLRKFALVESGVYRRIT